MNANAIPATIGKALEVLSWREEQIEVLKETIERMDGEMTQKDKRIAELEEVIKTLKLDFLASLDGDLTAARKRIMELETLLRQAGVLPGDNTCGCV